MGSEILLYGYGIICLSMIVFNVIYGIIMRGNDARLFRRSVEFENGVEAQIYRVYRKEPLEERHTKRMMRRLSHINNLIAFDQTLERCLAEGNEKMVREYLGQLKHVFLHLAIVYRKRENIQAAYFAYFLYRHRVNAYMQIDAIQNILVDYMKKNSLYCRVNALKALCAFGNPDCILKAVTIQDISGTFLHGKILTECLMSYEGDSDRLIRMLWERLDRFSVQTQRAILDYIRFKTGDYCEEFFSIMTDPGRDRELRFSGIRYFGRYPYPPARSYLLGFLKDTAPEDWEYAAISASALAAYPGQDVVDGLMEAMHSGNWYIRYNAASCLEAHGLGYSDLLELVGGRDRYAREMIMYRLENRNRKNVLEMEQREETEETGESEGEKTTWV